MKRFGFLLAATLCLGCGGSFGDADGKLTVAVSIPPQKWLVEQIGGDRVRVVSVLEPSDSPHTYQPTDAEVSRILSSQVYFRIGATFEEGQWYDGIRAAGVRVADFREGIALRESDAPCIHEGEQAAHLIRHTVAGQSEPEAEAACDAACDHAAGDHEHGPDCDHAGHAADHAACPYAGHGPHCTHGHGESVHAHAHGKDPHVWLAPALIRRQAETVARTLAQADPQHRAYYEANLQKVQARLDEIDQEIRQRLAPHRGKAIFLFHPAWGYFTDAYGLRQIAIEIEGKEPSDGELTEILTHARQHGAKVIFVQPQITSRSADAVARAIGGRTEILDPLAGDVDANLLRAAEAIARSFE